MGSELVGGVVLVGLLLGLVWVRGREKRRAASRRSQASRDRLAYRREAHVSRTRALMAMQALNQKRASE